jgi:hypothetical protein
MVLSEMNPLLLELWREKHPQGQEQFALGFEKRGLATDVETVAPVKAGDSVSSMPSDSIARSVALRSC